MGYMGSGKTTIARILAHKLQWNMLDLDILIEQHCGLSIRDIFAKRGEIFFRKVERQILQETIVEKSDFVLALGGGTPCYADNHLLLIDDRILSVYLKTSVGSLKERLEKSSAGRPLISAIAEDERAEFIAKHLFDRSRYYNSATLKVSTDDKTPEETAAEIIAALT